ncbi:MAG: 2-hydroxyacid dehydrogenase [Sporomusaceae bacterium]|nr:2-hydroxyacid dehydrogenase [Sporomusaceae bacterium]
MNCIFLDQITDEMKALLCQEAPQDLELIFLSELEEAEQEKKLAEADAFLTATYKVDEAFMSKAPKLKIVQKVGVGTDNIDSVAAAKRGIVVGNVPGGNANGVAELTIGLILDLYRKTILLDRRTRAGQWSMWTYRSCSYEIKGKTHGIVGFGHIGKRVAELSRAFGTTLLYYNRTRLEPSIEAKYQVKYASLEEVLQQSDIVSVHLPLTSGTRDFIAAKELAQMKPSSVLIHVGRGNVVNEQALYEALRQGKIAGAAIDVWASEPVAADNPLLQLDNVVATPHVGGGTVDAAIEIYRASFEKIGCLLRS